MTRYALFLRGINVGTNNSLPMADLRALLADAGCVDVATYVQSGNAVLSSPLGEARLAAEISKRVSARMGRDVPVTLRTKPELAAIVAACPFDAALVNGSHLCVSFLTEAPAPEELSPLTAQVFTPDEWVLAGREIYSHHPNGQGKSALAAALSKLRVRGTLTTRNWNTTTKVLGMM